MRRIGIVTRNEIISGDVIVGNRIRNAIDEPFRSYGYEPEKWKKNSLGKKFQSFLMKGEILRYDRYSGALQRTKDKPLHIPFGFIVFFYGIGQDNYIPDTKKQMQSKFDKGFDDKLFKFRIRCSLGRFELEGDCELSMTNYIINPITGTKEITSFPEGFLTLKNPNILSIHKKLKYANTAHSISTKYFDLGGSFFDIYEEKNSGTDLKDPVRISNSYFGINPSTPIIISTKDRLLGIFSYQEI